jgi:hypothetical protein
LRFSRVRVPSQGPAPFTKTVKSAAPEFDSEGVELLKLLRGRSATRSRARAGIPQENSRRRRRAKVGSVRLEDDVTTRRSDSRRGASAIRLRAVRGDGNELRRGRAAGGGAGTSIADEHIGNAVGIAGHQIPGGRKESHVAPIRSDGGRETVSVGGIAAKPHGHQCDGRRATGGRAGAGIADKDVFRRPRSFRDAVRGCQN